MFTELCDYYHYYLISEHFHYWNPIFITPYPLPVTPHSSLPPALATNGLLLWLVSFMWHAFEIHPGCSMYQYLIPFYGWIIFHHMDGPCEMDIWVSTFWLLQITLLWTFAYKFLWGGMICILLDVHLGAKLWDHMGPCWNFEFIFLLPCLRKFLEA